MLSLLVTQFLGSYHCPPSPQRLTLRVILPKNLRTTVVNSQYLMVLDIPRYYILLFITRHNKLLCKCSLPPKYIWFLLICLPLLSARQEQAKVKFWHKQISPEFIDMRKSKVSDGVLDFKIHSLFGREKQLLQCSASLIPENSTSICIHSCCAKL